MNKLDAVNRVLLACGLQTVTALNTGGGSIQGMVERQIDAIDAQEQARGWHFNRRYGVVLSPAQDGTITVPDCFSIDTGGESASMDVTVRDGKLYRLDVDGGSDQFDGDVTVDMIDRVAWTDLPRRYQEFICASAAEMLNRSHVKSTAMAARIEEQLMRARTDALREDGENADVNLLSTQHAQNIRGRCRPRWR